MNLHEKFTYFRKNRNYLLTDLAQQIKMSRNNLTAIEQGRYYPKLSSIFKFCLALNIPIDSLFSDDDAFLFFELESYINLTTEENIDNIYNFIKSIKTNEPIQIKNKESVSIKDTLNIKYKNNIDIKHIFANRLAHYQEKSGLSQYEFTEVIDISLSFLKDMKAGRKLPSVEKFQKICKLLHVPAYCLIQGFDEALYYKNKMLYDNIRKLNRDR